MIQNKWLPYILFATLLLLPFNTQVFYMALPKALGMPGMLLSSWKEGMFALMAMLLVAELLLGSRVPILQRSFNLSVSHVSGFFLSFFFSSCSCYPTTKESLFSASGILGNR